MEKKLTVVDIHIYSSRSVPMPSRNISSGTTYMIPICSDCQKEFDLMHCLQIQPDTHTVELVSTGESNVELKLPFPSPTNKECRNVPLPSTLYKIYLSLASVLDPDCHNSPDLIDVCKVLTYYNEGNAGNRLLKLDGLVPNTRYAIKIELTNLYSDPTRNNSFYTYFTTEEGPPSNPRDVTVEVISPESIAITWKPPATIQSSSLSYEIHWQSEDLSHGVRHSGVNVTDVSNKLIMSYTINGLASDQLYDIWVVALSGRGKKTELSASQKQTVRTFPNPPVIRVTGVGPRELNFTWTKPESSSILAHNFIIYPKGEINASWHISDNDLVNSDDSKFFHYYVRDLSPGICYIIKVLVRYKPLGPYYESPTSETSCYNTLVDKPLPPGTPIILEVSQNNQVTVTWKENDKNVEAYELQMRLAFREEGELNIDSWTSLDDNLKTNEYSLPSGFSGNYSFRVRARNSFDWGNFSMASHPQDIERIRQAQLFNAHSSQMTIGAICAGIVGFLLVACALYCLLLKNRSFVSIKKKSLLGGPSTKRTDRELEDLREFPIRHGFIDANNPMYQVELPTDEELALIHKIKRSQITLTKFIGSGAFGEVYEGLVKGLEMAGEDGSDMKIAVKTLRKGATESEKAEFLKEAKLMWNFKHEHILNLNAICLDNDPHFLILELMEGSDLLSYLRQNRPKGLIHSISLLDLVQMCLDVSKGKYTYTFELFKFYFIFLKVFFFLVCL